MSGFVVQKHWRATQERIEKFISDKYFTDTNLHGSVPDGAQHLTYYQVLYSANAPLHLVKWYQVPNKSIISFEEAKAGLNSIGTDITSSVKGLSIGPTWSTHWFECHVIIPEEWEGKHVRLRWDSCSEAMVWMDGQPQQGLTGSSDGHQVRTDFILTTRALSKQEFVLYIEVACNGMFGAGRGGLINPPDPDTTFTISVAEVSVFEEDVYQLLMDITVLYDLTKELPEGSARAYEALYAANTIINSCNPFNPSTFEECRAISAKFFGERNGDAQHTVHVMGHCHIDSAWLWPYSETRRKCGRSWSSVVRLMDRFPELTFVCSQAQQLEWVKTDYPSLYQKIKTKAQSGRFIVAGGTWVEMDGNIPGGESFVRQFLLGQSFFKQEFGQHCTEFWLPDTFGYSAQIPQIMIGAGIKYFLTQKLSWNLTNKFPHTSFLWEGIDGTSVLSHMPPADSYESRADVKDFLKCVTNSKDKGRSRHSVLLYGHGDGGGGPTEEMMEFMRRMKDLDGLPRIEHSNPAHFFSVLENIDKHNLCTWVGELYLELHRGTYTSQAKLKYENRRGEFLFHDVDFLTAANLILGEKVKRMAEVQQSMLPLWKQFLLNQFHDVIPGSCIQKVVEDAMQIYHDVKQRLEELYHEQLLNVISKVLSRGNGSSFNKVVLNSFSWERRSVIADDNSSHSQSKKTKLSDEVEEGLVRQTLSNGCTLKYIKVPAMSIGSITEIRPQSNVLLTKSAKTGEYIFENSIIRATVTSCGLLSSLVHKESGREAICAKSFGNQFVLFDDIPLFWDAWDVMEYHLETRNPIFSQQEAQSQSSSKDIQIMETGPLRASLQVALAISSKSKIIQSIILEADSPYVEFKTQVDWNESHKFLKVEFPLNVRSHEATYEIQFGHFSRPTHFNTSWNQAQFEVCGQKWADMSEHGFGVALLNNCKYGYSTLHNIMRLSLLRSPKAPDENCDMGTHYFSYAIMPHKGTFQEAGVVQEGYNFNQPWKIIDHDLIAIGTGSSLLTVDNPAVITETLKLCENISKQSSLLMRLYEAYGSHASANLVCPLATGFQRCNLLEEITGPLINGSVLQVELHPFEIASYILYV